MGLPSWSRVRYATFPWCFGLSALSALSALSLRRSLRKFLISSCTFWTSSGLFDSGSRLDGEHISSTSRVDSGSLNWGNFDFSTAIYLSLSLVPCSLSHLPLLGALSFSVGSHI